MFCYKKLLKYKINFRNLIKAIFCVSPLSLSIFVLVPLLSDGQRVHKTRISMLIGLVGRPFEPFIISMSGAALHYFLPILNPMVNVDVSQSPLTVGWTYSVFPNASHVFDVIF